MLVIVCTALFFILHLVPGSPARAILGETATEEQVKALNDQLGFNLPLWEQYLRWFGNLLRGDLGYSITQGGSVTKAVIIHLGPTLLLAVLVTVLSVVVAVPLAVHSIMRPNSVFSRLLPGGAAFALAVPSFWLGLMLVLVFAVWLGIVPVGGYVSPIESFTQSLWYLCLPVVTLVASELALLVLTLREGLAAEYSQAYVRSARSKGLLERAVLYRHVLPNALLPALTVVGSTFGTLLGGIIIVETVFMIPGIGWTLFSAMNGRDYNLVLGVALVSALLVMLVNLIVDVLYGLLDPRVKVK